MADEFTTPPQSSSPVDSVEWSALSLLLPLDADAYRLGKLEEELESGFADVDSIRKSLEERKVPANLRHKIWKVCRALLECLILKVLLGVNAKPDVLSGQKSRAQDASPLQEECKKAAGLFRCSLIAKHWLPVSTLPLQCSAHRVKQFFSFLEHLGA